MQKVFCDVIYYTKKHRKTLSILLYLLLCKVVSYMRMPAGMQQRKASWPWRRRTVCDTECDYRFAAIIFIEEKFPKSACLR